MTLIIKEEHLNDQSIEDYLQEYGFNDRYIIIKKREPMIGKLICFIFGHHGKSLDSLRGVAGPFKCSRCSYYHKGIKWPKPPDDRES